MTIIRVISRGGLTKETELVEVTPDRKVLLRWPYGAGVWDFMLAHGGQVRRPASGWKWRIHEDDLAELQSQAKSVGILEVRNMKVPAWQEPKTRAPRSPKENPKQLGFFKS